MDYKELFINKGYDEPLDISTEIKYKGLLKNLEMYENRLDYPDNFFDFSDNQIETTLLSLAKGKAEATNNQFLGVYLKYIRWARLNDISKQTSNSFNDIFDKVKQILAEGYGKAKLSKFVSKEMIYSLEDSDLSRRDLIAYTSVFEGIHGKAGREILDLKYSDVDWDNNKVDIKGNTRTVPSQLIKQFKLAIDCGGYYGGANGNMFFPFEETDYILKTVPKHASHYEYRKASTIWTILRTKSEKYLGKKTNTENLKVCGICHYLSLIELKNKKLTDKEFLQVAVRYNKSTKSDVKLRDIKKDYDLYKEFCKQTQIEFKLDEESLVILNEIEGLDFEYPNDYKGTDVVPKRKKPNNNDNKYINNINIELNKFEDETEKEAFLKVRIGHGLFKKRLLSRSCKCEICGFDYKNLLVASHCKPWSKSDNYERLNPNNGLILCPAHDSLFDKGLIYFDNEGNIQLSKKMNKDQFKQLNIKGNEKIHLEPEQIEFIEWHRKNHDKLK